MCRGRVKRRRYSNLKYPRTYSRSYRVPVDQPEKGLAVAEPRRTLWWQLTSAGQRTVFRSPDRCSKGSAKVRRVLVSRRRGCAFDIVQ